MAYVPLTWERKDQILDAHSITILRKIQINPYFMAVMVSAGVMDVYLSQDILALKTPGQKKNALIKHLQCSSVEVFISFCIVLEEEQKRPDIVRDEFGLQLQHLKHQRDAIREEERQANAASEASAGSAANTASKDSFDPKRGQHENMEEGLDEVDVTPTATSKPGDIAEKAQGNPTITPDTPPSRTLVPDDIESLSGDLGSIEIKECKMLHDPTGHKQLDLTELRPSWKAEELGRLRKSFSDKPHKPVVIALLDTGVNTSHPDLQSSGMIIDSRNFVGVYDEGRAWFYPPACEEQDVTLDYCNHGTMSAGIVWQCATQDNVQLLNLKVMRRHGWGHSRYITEALRYIKQWDKVNKHMPVDIVLMTLGSSLTCNHSDKLLAELGESKILVCSAANEGQTKANSVLSPANHGSVIAIGSSDRLGNRCSHSSVGQELDFLFPGENIQSTSSHYNPLKPNSRYVEKSGTSFAAPYAAALMALVLCYVETHITELNGQDGAYWRKVLTKSAEMKCLLRDVCCRREHSHERGFGTPELERIGKDGILAYLKQQFNIPD